MENEIIFFKYSNKSMCVSGDGTKDIKEKLKELGGRFNRSLIDPETQEKMSGFVIPLKAKEEVEKLLGMTLIDIEIEAKAKKEYKKEEELSIEDINEEDIDFFMYSDRSFLVGGKTKPMKEDLKSMGGKWNGTLKGWIFGLKRLEEVEDYLEMEVDLTRKKK